MASRPEPPGKRVIRHSIAAPAPQSVVPRDTIVVNPPLNNNKPPRRATPYPLSISDPEPAAEYFDGLQNAFWHGDYSDVIVWCGSKGWNVHKFQLCQHSTVFASALTKDNRYLEIANIELKDENEAAVGQLLRFMYSFIYPPSPSFGTHMLVYNIAIKYDVQQLASQALDRFCKDVKYGWDGSSFAAAINTAYSQEGYKKFREPLVEVAVKQLSSLRSGGQRYRAFWDAVDACPEFATQLLKPVGFVSSKSAATPKSAAPPKPVGTTAGKRVYVEEDDQDDEEPAMVKKEEEAALKVKSEVRPKKEGHAPNGKKAKVEHKG